MRVVGNITNPSVIIIGVFHGDEPQGEFLINEYLKSVNLTNILFIPRLNDQNTRVNKNGVDLNRNFPTKNWIKSTNKDNYFGGNEPASEDETKLIINLVEKYEPKVILTLHAPYKVVNYDGDKYGYEIVETISKLMNYPIEPSIGYPTPGSFGTWAGIEKGFLTITLELDEEIDIDELKKPVFKVFDYLEGIK